MPEQNLFDALHDVLRNWDTTWCKVLKKQAAARYHYDEYRLHEIDIDRELINAVIEHVRQTRRVILETCWCSIGQIPN